MEFFERSGFKSFMFTTKHYEGFSLFDTTTRVWKHVNWTTEGGPENYDLAYSITEAPFCRVIVKEVCDAAHRIMSKSGIMFNFYTIDGNEVNGINDGIAFCLYQGHAEYFG